MPPAFRVDAAPTRFPALSAWDSDDVFNQVARNPPLKASPAPVVSTDATFTGADANSPAGPTALLPRAPSLITTIDFRARQNGSAPFKSVASPYNAASLSFTNTRSSASMSAGSPGSRASSSFQPKSQDVVIPRLHS